MIFVPKCQYKMLHKMLHAILTTRLPEKNYGHPEFKKMENKLRASDGTSVRKLQNTSFEIEGTS